MNGRANRLARQLQSQGIGPEKLVGIFCRRSLDLMVAVLGVLKAGGAYVPLDPGLPAERLAFLLDDCKPELTLTQSSLAGRLPQMQRRLCIDRQPHPAGEPPAPNPESGAGLDHLAYVLYTSGSTGIPKGVEVPHRGLTNYLWWAADAYSVAEGEGSLVHSSIGFDATITSWFTPLLAGKTVTLLPEENELEALAAALQSGRRWSLVKLTPAHLEALSHLLPEDARPQAGAFVIGGEALFGRQLAFWQAKAPRTRLFNEYGPTETVVGCCVHEAESTWRYDGAIPIGRPIANTRLYVLDADRKPAPPGVPGELFIGGHGVARGYRNRPELTAERFVANPFGPGRLYRTGDLARRMADGNLIFHGRLDDQVKIRGFRVEPAEIDAALTTHPAVKTCATVVRVDAAGDKQLVAYVSPRPGAAHSREIDWAGFLAGKLPHYMIPAAYVLLDRLPLTANGKLDRAALPRPDLSRNVRRSRSPQSSLELQLLRVWERVLGVRPIGVQDDFFHLGGHSLMALRLMTRIERTIGRALPLSAIVEAPTVEKMAGLIAGKGVEPNPGALVAIQPEGSRPPLFCIHGIGGSILNYGHLARHLPDDQPLYGLQARGIDGKQAPHTRVADMAAEYIERIRSTQPVGPYYLCGYSFGGLVAFEMACQLEAAGDRAGLVLLLDTTAPGAPGTPQQSLSWRAMFRSQLGRLRLHGGNLWRLGFSGKKDYIASRLRTVARKLGNHVWQVRYTAYEKFRQPIPAAFLDVKQASYMAAREYVPGKCASPAVLFRAEQRRLPDDDPALGWTGFIGGGVTVRVSPGEHNTIAVGENAAVLAREIMAALDRAQQTNLGAETSVDVPFTPHRQMSDTPSGS